MGASAGSIRMKHHEDKQYRVSDLIEANHIIKELKNTKNTVIKISPLKLEEIVWGASSLNHSDGKGQGGFAVELASRGFTDGKMAAFNMLHWASKRTRRCVRSSLGSEVMALDDGCAECEWLRATWYDMLDRTNMIRDNSRYGPDEMVAMVGHLGPMSRETPTELVVDAKGLYDHLHTPAAMAGPHERRTLMYFKMMAHSVRCLRGQVRWILGDIMCSHRLTKGTDQATLTRWAMSNGKCGVTEEAVMSILKELSTTTAKYDKVSTKGAKKVSRTAHAQLALTSTQVITEFGGCDCDSVLCPRGFSTA